MSDLVSLASPRQIELFTQYRKGCDVFVETGTQNGRGTASAILAGFPCVVSFEVSRPLFVKACKALLQRVPIPGQHNMEGLVAVPGKSTACQILLYHASSAGEVFRRFVKDLNKPALFWLDAHKMDDKGKTCNDYPLGTELGVLNNRTAVDRLDVVLINAYRLLTRYGVTESTIERLQTTLGTTYRKYSATVNPGYVGDVCVLAPRRSAPGREQHTISLITPAYKADQWLRRYLDSACSQVPGFTEILIGIDACQATLEEAQRCKQTYPDIRLFWFPSHTGCYLIRNTLSMASVCNHLSFFDADDEMLPGYLKHHRKLSIPYKGAPHFVYSGGSLIKDGEVVKVYRLNGCNFTLPTSLFRSLGGFEPWECGADSELTSRVGPLRIPSEAVEDPIMLRHGHSESLTLSKDTGQKSPLRKVYSDLMKYRKMLRHSMAIPLHVAMCKELGDEGDQTLFDTSYILGNYPAIALRNGPIKLPEARKQLKKMGTSSGPGDA